MAEIELVGVPFDGYGRTGTRLPPHGCCGKLESSRLPPSKRAVVLGCSVAIYDPDQDPDRTGARRIVELVGQIARSLQ